MGYESKLNKECREILDAHPEVKEQCESIRNETHLVRAIDLMLPIRAWGAYKVSDDAKEQWGLKKLRWLTEQRVSKLPSDSNVAKSLLALLKEWENPSSGKPIPHDEAARLFCQQSAMEDWMQLTEREMKQKPGTKYGLEFFAAHATWRERHLAPCDLYVDECFERLCGVLAKHRDHAKEVVPLRMSNTLRHVFAPYAYGSARFERLMKLATKFGHGANEAIFTEGVKPLSDNGFWNSRIPSSVKGSDLAKWTFEIVTKGNRVKMPGFGESFDRKEFENLAPEDPTVANLLPAIAIVFDKREFVSPLKNFHQPRPRFSLFEDESDYKETHQWLLKTISAAERGDSGQAEFFAALQEPIVQFGRILDTPALAMLLFRLIGFASQSLLKINGALRTQLRGYTVLFDGCFIGPEDRLEDGRFLPRAVRVKLDDSSFQVVPRNELLAAPRLANKIGEGDFTTLHYVWRLLPRKGRAAVHSFDTDTIDYSAKYTKLFGKSREHHITVISESPMATNIWNMTVLTPLLDEAYDGCNLESFFGLHMLEGPDFVPHTTGSQFPLHNLTKVLRERAKTVRESKEMVVFSMLPPPIVISLDPVDPSQLQSGRGEFTGETRLRKPVIEMQQPNFEAFVKLYLEAVRVKRPNLEAQSPRGPWFYTLATGPKNNRQRFLQIGSQPPLTLAQLQAVYRRIRVHQLMFFAMFEMFDLRTFGLQTAANGESMYGFLGHPSPVAGGKLKVTAPLTVFGGEKCLVTPAAAAAARRPIQRPQPPPPVQPATDIEMKPASEEPPRPPAPVPLQLPQQQQQRRPSKPNLVVTKEKKSPDESKKQVAFQVFANPEDTLEQLRAKISKRKMPVDDWTVDPTCAPADSYCQHQTTVLSLNASVDMGVLSAGTLLDLAKSETHLLKKLPPCVRQRYVRDNPKLIKDIKVDAKCHPIDGGSCQHHVDVVLKDGWCISGMASATALMDMVQHNQEQLLQRLPECVIMSALEIIKARAEEMTENADVEMETEQQDAGAVVAFDEDAELQPPANGDDVAAMEEEPTNDQEQEGFEDREQPDEKVGCRPGFPKLDKAMRVAVLENETARPEKLVIRQDCAASDPCEHALVAQVKGSWYNLGLVAAPVILAHIGRGVPYKLPLPACLASQQQVLQLEEDGGPAADKASFDLQAKQALQQHQQEQAQRAADKVLQATQLGASYHHPLVDPSITQQVLANPGMAANARFKRPCFPKAPVCKHEAVVYVKKQWYSIGTLTAKEIWDLFSPHEQFSNAMTPCSTKAGANASEVVKDIPIRKRKRDESRDVGAELQQAVNDLEEYSSSSSSSSSKRARVESKRTPTPVDQRAYWQRPFQLTVEEPDSNALDGTWMDLQNSEVNVSGLRKSELCVEDAKLLTTLNNEFKRGTRIEQAILDIEGGDLSMMAGSEQQYRFDAALGVEIALPDAASTWTSWKTSTNASIPQPLVDNLFESASPPQLRRQSITFDNVEMLQALEPHVHKGDKLESVEFNFQTSHVTFEFGEFAQQEPVTGRFAFTILKPDESVPMSDE